MKRIVPVLWMLALAGGALGASAEEGMTPARELFVETHKCALCHGVPAAGIEAKTKSEKLKGPDLGGPLPEEVDLARLAAYLRKQEERGGKSHKREFKGSDEELQAIVDWLLEQKARPPESAGAPGAP